MTDTEGRRKSLMSKSEREELRRVIGRRAKALKAAAELRSAELLADFENQMASEYSYDDDKIWAEATEIAKGEIAKAQKRVTQRSRELGIPDRFAPQLVSHWSARGYDNAVKERRAELRRVAQTPDGTGPLARPAHDQKREALARQIERRLLATILSRIGA